MRGEGSGGDDGLVIQAGGASAVPGGAAQNLTAAVGLGGAPPSLSTTDDTSPEESGCKWWGRCVVLASTRWTADVRVFQADVGRHLVDAGTTHRPRRLVVLEDDGVSPRPTAAVRFCTAPPRRGGRASRLYRQAVRRHGPLRPAWTGDPASPQPRPRSPSGDVDEQPSRGKTGMPPA